MQLPLDEEGKLKVFFLNFEKLRSLQLLHFVKCLLTISRLVYMECQIKLHLMELSTVKLFKRAVLYKRIAPASVKGTVDTIVFRVELKSNSCVGVFSRMPINTLVFTVCEFV